MDAPEPTPREIALRLVAAGLAGTETLTAELAADTKNLDAYEQGVLIGHIVAVAVLVLSAAGRHTGLDPVAILAEFDPAPHASHATQPRRS